MYCPDTSLERAEEFASRYQALAFADYKKMLALPQVDAVCICTPSGLHGPLAIEAAEAGKHVVVEKPLAITMEQGRAVLTACKEHNVKLAVISSCVLLQPDRVKAAIDEGN